MVLLEVTGFADYESALNKVAWLFQTLSGWYFVFKENEGKSFPSSCLWVFVEEQVLDLTESGEISFDFSCGDGIGESRDEDLPAQFPLLVDLLLFFRFQWFDSELKVRILNVLPICQKSYVLCWLPTRCQQGCLWRCIHILWIQMVLSKFSSYWMLVNVQIIVIDHLRINWVMVTLSSLRREASNE